MNARDAAFEAIEYLVGTCNANWEYENWDRWEDDQEFHAIIDDYIFRCSQCEWWHPISEMENYEEQICESCSQ